LLTATVDRLGVFALHHRRLAALQCLNGRDKTDSVPDDPLLPVVETLQGYHPGCSCGPPNVDAEFGRHATGAVMRHLIHLKQRRDPLARR
jgi:hypothetical protein